MASRSRDGHKIVWEIDDVTARRIVEALLKAAGHGDEVSRYQSKFSPRYQSLADELGDKLDELPPRTISSRGNPKEV